MWKLQPRFPKRPGSSTSRPICPPRHRPVWESAFASNQEYTPQATSLDAGSSALVTTPMARSPAGIVGSLPRGRRIQPFEKQIDRRRVQQCICERRRIGPIPEKRDSRQSRRRSVEVAVRRVIETSVGFLPPAKACGKVDCELTPWSLAGRGEDADCRRRPVKIRAVGTFVAREPTITA